MPPNKGASMKQRTLNFKSVKSVKQANKLKANKTPSAAATTDPEVPIKKPRGKAAQNAKLAKCDMHVKLHIPVSICRNLPSVKTKLASEMKKSAKLTGSTEQRGMGVYKRHSVAQLTKEEIEEENAQTAKTLLGAKKRRGECIKYQLHLEKEEKFKGMVFDLAFSRTGDVIVACTEEAVLCDSNLKRKRTLEKVMSPGGVATLRTGEILVVCRCSDNVNVFTASGVFKRSFHCGPSPCGVTVNSSDEIIVTDTGAKLVRFYSPEGKLLRTIESSGSDYALKWPIYATTNAMDDVIVSDCHQQKVLVFDENGVFKSRYHLRTQGGNQVRCLNEKNILISCLLRLIHTKISLEPIGFRLEISVDETMQYNGA